MCTVSIFEFDLDNELSKTIALYWYLMQVKEMELF